MLTIKLFVCTALLTSIGIGSADAVSNPTSVRFNARSQTATGPVTVTISSHTTAKKSLPVKVCFSMQGLAYGAALVGLQSTLIVLPSFASGGGAPVGAIATGVGAVATGVGFLTMVVHDMACK